MFSIDGSRTAAVFGLALPDMGRAGRKKKETENVKEKRRNFHDKRNAGNGF